MWLSGMIAGLATPTALLKQALAIAAWK